VADAPLAVTVRWKPVSEPKLSSYTVITSSGGPVLNVPAADPVAVISGLRLGARHTFTVRALTPGGAGPESKPSNEVVVKDVPLAPVALGACASDGTVRVSAPAVAGATGYNLYVSETPGVTKSSTKLEGVTLPYAHTSLTNGTPHYFALAAVDGAMEGPLSAELSASPRSASPLSDVAFVVHRVAQAVEVWDTVSALSNGDVATRVLSGAATGIAGPLGGLAVDKESGLLFVANSQPRSVVVWENADTVTGNVAPTRTLAGAATGLQTVVGLAFDHKRFLVYASNREGSIVSFSNGCGASGNARPLATLSGARTTLGGSVGAIALDEAADRLWVASGGSLVAFAGVSATRGAVDPAPERTLTLAGMTDIGGLAVDPATDTLYVSSRNEGRLYTIAGASTKSGAVSPSATASGAPFASSGGLCLAGGQVAQLRDGGGVVQLWAPASLTGTPSPLKSLNTMASAGPMGVALVP
jgi:hypothetical protein